MKIKILATESLGVRGLCCAVETEKRRIIIDPGIALGYNRHGLLPHPVQVAVDEIIQQQIINELKVATDIVLSHFHGDHVPLMDANPYQLHLRRVSPFFHKVRVWAKEWEQSSIGIQKRARNIARECNGIIKAEGKCDRELEFLEAVPHGKPDSSLGKVMITKITSGGSTFVHASDIQFLCSQTINKIISLHPNIVLASGPPLYLSHLKKADRTNAWDMAKELANKVDLLIIDHHLLRCEEGLTWLRNLNNKTSNRVMCAADYMNIHPHLLEAKRTSLYKKIPVSSGWHGRYATGSATTQQYLDIARKLFPWFAY